MSDMNDDANKTLELAEQLKLAARTLQEMNRYDLILKALGTPLLEELKLEAAKNKLSRLYITHDYQFVLTDYNERKIDLQPVHRAVYLLFLQHPEGIEFKRLSEYRDELKSYYKKTAPTMETEKMEEALDHLTNPLDNAINEKCSRIKKTFSDILDPYTLNYYIICGHARKHIPGNTGFWYQRRKVILLPRHLVVWADAAG